MFNLLVLATTNQNKVREFRQFVSEFPVTVKSLSDFGPLPGVVEDGSTFDENAYKKAHHYAKVLGIPAIADDSGLVVGALDGADVVALDARGRRRQRQGLGQLGQGALGLALVGQPAHLFTLERLGRVAASKRHQLAALAPLWHRDGDLVRGPAGQEVGQLVRLGQGHRHEHARRDGAGPRVVLLDERGQCLLVGVVGGCDERERQGEEEARGCAQTKPGLGRSNRSPTTK